MLTKVKDNLKCKESERRRRDHLNKAFKQLEQFLPNYDPAKFTSKIEILEKATQFIKELRLSNSRLSSDSEKIQSQEMSSKIQNLQDEMNKLILRVKQLTALLVQAKIPIPIGPSIKMLGKKRLKWSNKIQPERIKHILDQPQTPNNAIESASNKIVVNEKSKSEKIDAKSCDQDLEPNNFLSSCSPISDSATKTKIVVTASTGKDKESEDNAARAHIPTSPSKTKIIVTTSSNSKPQLETHSHNLSKELNESIGIGINNHLPLTSSKVQQLTPIQNIMSLPFQPNNSAIFITPFSPSQLNAQSNLNGKILARVFAQPSFNYVPSKDTQHNRLLPKTQISSSAPLQKIPIVSIRKPIPKKKFKRNRKKKIRTISNTMEMETQTQNQSALGAEIGSDNSNNQNKISVSGAFKQKEARVVTISLDDSEDINMETKISKNLVEKTDFNQTKVKDEEDSLIEMIDLTSNITDTDAEIHKNNLKEAHPSLQILNEIESDRPSILTVSIKKVNDRLENQNDEVIIPDKLSPTKEDKNLSDSSKLNNIHNIPSEISYLQSNTKTPLPSPSFNTINIIPCQNEDKLSNSHIVLSDNSTTDKNSNSTKLTIPSIAVEALLDSNTDKNSPLNSEKINKNAKEIEEKFKEASEILPIVSDSVLKLSMSLIPGKSIFSSDSINFDDIESSISLSADKMSECIARSIDLIERDDGEESELLELGGDWSSVVRVTDPKLPISPTQMFLSMFPLLPQNPTSIENSNISTSNNTIQRTGRSSFFIDSMLPEETNSGLESFSTFKSAPSSTLTPLTSFYKSKEKEFEDFSSINFNATPSKSTNFNLKTNKKTENLSNSKSLILLESARVSTPKISNNSTSFYSHAYSVNQVETVPQQNLSQFYPYDSRIPSQQQSSNFQNNNSSFPGSENETIGYSNTNQYASNAPTNYHQPFQNTNYCTGLEKSQIQQVSNNKIYENTSSKRVNSSHMHRSSSSNQSNLCISSKSLSSKQNASSSSTSPKSSKLRQKNPVAVVSTNQIINTNQNLMPVTHSSPSKFTNKNNSQTLAHVQQDTNLNSYSYSTPVFTPSSQQHYPQIYSNAQDNNLNYFSHVENSPHKPFFPSSTITQGNSYANTSNYSSATEQTEISPTTGVSSKTSTQFYMPIGPQAQTSQQFMPQNSQSLIPSNSQQISYQPQNQGTEGAQTQFFQPFYKEARKTTIQNPQGNMGHKSEFFKNSLNEHGNYKNNQQQRPVNWMTDSQYKKVLNSNSSSTTFSVSKLVAPPPNTNYCAESLIRKNCNNMNSQKNFNYNYGEGYSASCNNLNLNNADNSGQKSSLQMTNQQQSFEYDFSGQNELMNSFQTQDLGRSYDNLGGQSSSTSISNFNLSSIFPEINDKTGGGAKTGGSGSARGGNADSCYFINSGTSRK